MEAFRAANGFRASLDTELTIEGHKTSSQICRLLMLG